MMVKRISTVATAERSGAASRLTLAALLVTGACALPGDAPSSTFVARDSNGIRIVENHSPQLPPGTWQLSAEPLAEISGHGTTLEEVPLDPVSVFGGPEGEIVVGDGNQVGWRAVLVYDSPGRFLRRMGGRGEGPGELRGQLWLAEPYHGDSVAVWDRTGPTVHVYAVDGGFGRSVLLPQPPVVTPEGVPGFTPGFVGALADGSLVSYPQGALEIPDEPGPAWYRHLLLKLAPNGARHDTIGDFRFAQYNFWDGREAVQIAIPHWVHELTYGDELIRASTERYEYEVLRSDGTRRLFVRRMVTPEPVTRAHVDAQVRATLARAEASGRMSEDQIAQMRQRMESAPAPATMPVHSSILAESDGRVWVERCRWYDPWRLPPDPQPTTWDVFSPEGEWLTEVVVPARVVLRGVSGDRAYGVRIDETEVKHVVVYGIERGGA